MSSHEWWQYCVGMARRVEAQVFIDEVIFGPLVPWNFYPMVLR